MQTGPNALKLLGPFSNVIDGFIKDQFIRNWLDLLCFLLSGAHRLLLLCSTCRASCLIV